MKLRVIDLSREELSTLLLGAVTDSIITKYESERGNDLEDLLDTLMKGECIAVWALNPSNSNIGETKLYKRYLVNVSAIKRGLNKAIKANPYNLTFFMDGEVTGVSCECIMQYTVYGKIVF